MKKAILFFGIAAAVALASCTKENLVNKTENKVFTGDKAYVIVNINDVGTSATKGSDGGFFYGRTDEYAVNDAHFYFYGSDGAFVAESDAWNENGTEQPDTPANIDFESNTILTLYGLADKSYPTWVVTVLNAPENFEAPEQLEDFYRLLASASDEGYSKKVGETTYYTMSTSSYVDSDNGYPTDSPAYWFATPVKPENFSLEELTGDGDTGYVDGNGDPVDPIDIYVERLAVKVILASSVSPNDDGYYPITVETDGDDELVEDVVYYVRINGWKLNATARQSNIVKTVRGTDVWNNSYFYPATTVGSYTDFGTDWNDVENHRSYWGESYNYDLGKVPTTSDGNYDSGNDGKNEEDSGIDDYLLYTSLGENVTLNKIYGEGVTSGYYQYCAENTNTAGEPPATTGKYITYKNSSVVTSILVSATLFSYDEENDAYIEGLDYVRCDGLLYSEKDFLAYALSHIDYAVKDGDSYESITTDYLTLVNDYDGNVHVEVASAYYDTIFYVVDWADAKADPDNIDDYVTAVTYTAVNTALTNKFNDIYGSDANSFKGGEMYYNIPIEHLNDDYDEKYTKDGNQEQLILEGNYGVVRNHIYYVTITDIENVGRGIYDTDEVIVPQPEVDTYSLTAQVNILAWKLVEQDVVL